MIKIALTPSRVTQLLLLALLLVSPRARAACDSNLLIVLDRSCSMNNSPGGGEPRTKWEIALEALDMMMTTYAGKLRFGLIMFPDATGANCAQDGQIYVNVGPGQEANIRTVINATTPTGPCVTNIDTAMAQVGSDPAYAAANPERRSFVLLVSDGEQSNSCGGVARDSTTVTNITTLYDSGFPTYVVGFGDGVRPASLEAFSMAGGVPKSGSPNYYQANTPAELQATLMQIAGQAVGSDLEFSSCQSTPCPDGRCYGMGESCTNGFCSDPNAVGDGGSSNGNGDGGAAAGSGMASGCDCQLAPRGPGRSSGVWALGVLLAVAIIVSSRRRRRRRARANF